MDNNTYKTIKGLKHIAELSKSGHVPLFYSPKENEVYSTPAVGRFYLTELIRENTEEEIADAVRRIMEV